DFLLLDREPVDADVAVRVGLQVRDARGRAGRCRNSVLGDRRSRGKQSGPEDQRGNHREPPESVDRGGEYGLTVWIKISDRPRGVKVWSELAPRLRAGRRCARRRGGPALRPTGRPACDTRRAPSSPRSPAGPPPKTPPPAPTSRSSRRRAAAPPA